MDWPGKPWVGTALTRSVLALLAVATIAIGCASASSKPHGETGSKARKARRVSSIHYRASAAAIGKASRSLHGSLRQVAFASPALHRRDYYLIYLPPGYAAAARKGHRFGVLYLLHGDGIGKRHLAIHMFEHGKIGPQLDKLVASRTVPPFLVVMPESNDGTLADDMEWANTPRGNYESEVVDIVHKVDARWPTVASRSARAIAGLSMGGYGAVNVALHHPDLFSTVESWSGYFTQTRTGPFVGASPALMRANSPAAYLTGMAPVLRQMPFRFLLYGGIGDPLLTQQAPFAAQLRALGQPVQTAAFTGPHDFRLWSQHMSLALRVAGDGLKP